MRSHWREFTLAWLQSNRRSNQHELALPTPPSDECPALPGTIWWTPLPPLASAIGRFALTGNDYRGWAKGLYFSMHSDERVSTIIKYKYTMISYHLVSTVFNQQRQHSFQSAAQFSISSSSNSTVFNHSFQSAAAQFNQQRQCSFQLAAAQFLISSSSSAVLNTLN